MGPEKSRLGGENLSPDKFSRAPRGWKRHGGASCPRGVECPGCEDGRMLVDVYISSHIENRCVQNVMYTQIVEKNIKRKH